MIRRRFVLLGVVAIAACTGGGGEGDSPATSAIASRPRQSAASSTPVAFPVSSVPGVRHLVDAAGRPFGLRGRTAWYVLSRSAEEYARFLDDTRAKGFNAIEIKAITHDPDANNPPFAGNGAAPFLKRLDGGKWLGSLRYSRIRTQAPDFTTPNETYWSFVDAFLDACQARGIVVLMFPAYVGWGGGNQGWMQEMEANGATRMQSYGNWIANRYKGQSNLIWMLGGDYSDFTASQSAVEQELVNGLKSVAGQTSTVYSAEWASNSFGSDHGTFGRYLNFNGVYSWTGLTASYGRKAYGFEPVTPSFLLEEPYDEEGPDGDGFNPSATQPVRRFVYWGLLSTIGGYVAGNGYVWRFRTGWTYRDLFKTLRDTAGGRGIVWPPKTGWDLHLDTKGANDLKRLNDLLVSIDWWRLVPEGLSGMGTLVTQGSGSIDTGSYVAAAGTSAGDLLLAYIGPDHTGAVTIDMSRMRGTVSARWLDPTNGVYTAIGSYTNRGTQAFVTAGKNSAGDGDWILRLDAL